MSRLSDISKRQSRWKVSNDSSFINNDQSRTQLNYLLPERFTPSKVKLNDSKFMASFLEKGNSSKERLPYEPLQSPHCIQATGSILDGENALESSLQMKKVGVSKTKKQSNLSLKSKDSAISITVDQISKIRQEAIKDLTSEYEVNRRIILELKDDFNSFRESIITELKNHKNMIVKITEEVFQRVNIKNPEIQTIIKQISDNEDIFAKQIQSEVDSYADKGLNKAKEHVKPLSIYTPKHNKGENTNKNIINQVIPTLQSPLFSKDSKQSSNLQKCSHIVETVNQLNQINDTPVQMNPRTKPKSLQKRAIHDYKSKIMGLTLSPKAKIHYFGSQTQTKASNSKLDKFYSAIEKLKEQVNQIKQISNNKQSKYQITITQP